MQIYIDQPPVIDALNHWLANSRNLWERSLSVNTAGVCHGLSTLKAAHSHLEIYSQLEIKLAEFLAASPTERITLGTKAWRNGRWLADFIPLLQSLSQPFVNGKSFLRQSVMKSYQYAGLDVLGQYAVNLHAQKLAGAFGLCQLSDAPCTMIFTFNNHSIEVEYTNYLFSVYDPNYRCESFVLGENQVFGGSRFFANPKDAANYIRDIFVSVNKDKIPEPVPANLLFNTHILIVRTTSKRNAPLSLAFMERLKRIDAFSLHSKDCLGSTVLDHAFYRRHEKNTTTVTPKRYLAVLENRSNHEKFLQDIPIRTLHTILSDPYFKSQLEIPSINFKEAILEVIEHYQDHAEKQLAAALLYFLIKKEGRPLADILLRDFIKNEELTLIPLLGSEDLKKIRSSMRNIYAIKTINEILSHLIPAEVFNGSLRNMVNPDILATVMRLYFENRLPEALDYARQFHIAPQFILELRSAFLLVIILAVTDNRSDWFFQSFAACKVFKNSYLKNLLDFTIKHERRDMFAKVANEMTVADFLECYSLQKVAENGSADFLNYVIQYVSSKNILHCFLQSQSSLGESALHCAVFKGKIQQVRLLLDAGFNPEAISSSNETPLYIACALGHVEIAKIVFARSTVNYSTMLHGYSVFEAASNSANPQMLPELINLYLNRYSINELCTQLSMHSCCTYLLPHIVTELPLILNEFLDELLTLYPIQQLLTAPPNIAALFTQRLSQQSLITQMESSVDMMDLAAPLVPISSQAPEPEQTPPAVVFAPTGVKRKATSDAPGAGRLPEPPLSPVFARLTI
jgi:hypothetical protein